SSFLWLRTLVSEKIATICALLYMLMPYHLAIDFYRRCALPECWAMAWMPLVLYFAQNIVRGKRRSEIGLAFAFALMIISHLISVAMFFPIPIILAILLSDKGRRFSAALGGRSHGGRHRPGFFLSTLRGCQCEIHFGIQNYCCLQVV